MSAPIKAFGNGDPKLTPYALRLFKPEDSILAEIRTRSTAAGLPIIHVGAMDGLHLEVLTRAFGAKKVLEIGTLGGYSGVCIARGLASDGKLITLELHEKNAAIARESFQKAGVAEKCEVRVGPALNSLQNLSTEGPFDLVFIDADKCNYCNYFKWASKNVRIGGVILADNTFAWGLVLQDTFESKEAEEEGTGIKNFNNLIAETPNFRSTILPTGEGLTLSVRLF